jgi:chromosome partitioning protein
MPKIISVLNQKGGVGKTTLTVHLATALARAGERVLLVDADPQGSALDWSAARAGDPLFPVAGLPKASLHKDLPALAANYSAVLIDGPPRVYDVARSAIMASDLVLIPVQPSPYDVWAAKEIVDLLAEGVPLQAGPQVGVRRQLARSPTRPSAGDVADALAEYPVPVLAAAVCQRSVVRRERGPGPDRVRAAARRAGLPGDRRPDGRSPGAVVVKKGDVRAEAARRPHARDPRTPGWPTRRPPTGRPGRPSRPSG